jgi:hypothetical protein
MRIFMTVAVCFFGIVSQTTATKCDSGEIISASDCECAAGFRVSAGLRCDDGNCTNSSTRCVMCTPGTYSAAGDAVCTPCATGSYSYAGAASCDKGILDDTSNGYAAVENSFARFDGLIAANNEVDDAVNRVFESLDVDKYLSLHAPGLFACVVIGFVCAVLNSVAIGLVILWVRHLKSIEQKTDIADV